MSTKKNTAPEFTDDVDLSAKIEETANTPEVKDVATEVEETAPAVEEATPEVEELPEFSSESPKMSVKFVKSPMGYNLSYNAGDVAELPEAQAEYLIKLQIAELC
jgi:alkyl hydroperoxide reductase subunit AhpF